MEYALGRRATTDIFKVLIKKIKDINKTFIYANLKDTTITPLMLVSTMNMDRDFEEFEELIELLFEEGASLEATNNKGWTALHLLASMTVDSITDPKPKQKKQQVDRIELLIKKGNYTKHVNKLDNEGKTPLYLASEEGNLEVVKALVEFKDDEGDLLDEYYIDVNQMIMMIHT